VGRIITVDFETYYDKDYSLTNLTTQEYINHPYFQIIGVAVAVNGGEPEWHTGKSITHLDVAAFLSSYDLQEPGTITVAHNAMFDGAILEWKLGIKPWKYFCTMMGSRPWVVPYTGRMSLKEVSKYLKLGVKGTEVINALGKRLEDFSPEQLKSYAEYCRQDVRLTYKLFTRLYPMFPISEIRLIDLTIKKFTRPKLCLDPVVIKEALSEEREYKADLLAKANLKSPDPLMSNNQFADLLQELGVNPPRKISPTTKQETWAFSKGDWNFVRLLRHDNPKVRALVEARFAHKSTINETRLDRFLSLTKDNKEHILAAPLLYYGAHPGRFSGFDKLNLQNMGRKAPLRRAIVAPPGHKIIAGDLSQIEARITACLAGQKDLVDAFRYYDSLDKTDRDVYCQFGDSVYGRQITKADEKERFVAKTGVLSLGYQSGATKFYESMRSFGVEDFSPADAEIVVHTYRNLYTQIVEQWNTMESLIGCMAAGQGRRYGPIEVLLGQILLPNRMYLTYPDLVSTGRNWKYKFGGNWRDLYGGKLTENIVQALARIVMTTAELRLAKAGVRAALSVHDELIFVIPDEKVDVFVQALRKALTAPVEWMPELPVNCEIGVGDSYATAK
jgi:DNA polymerase